MIGLSNAPFSTASAVNQTTQNTGLDIQTAGQPGAYDQSLNRFINQLGTSKDAAAVLAYPLDTPKYIITFTMSEYTRTNLNKIGGFQDSGYPGIVLPLPQQLIDNDHVDWHEVEVGTLPGTFLNGLASLIQGKGFGTDANSLAAGGAIVGSGVAAVGGLPVGNPSGASSGFETLLGFSPNQFVTMLMRGPTYKRHSFHWELSPTNFAEADVLRRIIKTFKNAMAPNTFGAFGGAPILWTFPKVFYIRLYPNSKFMYKFKPCVLDQFSVNYTPGSRAAFNKLGTATIGDNAPANVQIVAHFIELEFWTEGNVTDSNDPDIVYEKAVNNSNLASAVDQVKQFTSEQFANLRDKANQIIGNPSGTNQ